MDTNAREELIKFLEFVQWRTLECAQISCGELQLILRVGYTEEDLREFYSKLDFEYDAGYGLQELFGTLWFQNGSWATRSEYDGKEWWALYQRPGIPEECK